MKPCSTPHLTLALLFAALPFAGPLAAAEPVFSPTRLKADVGFLADDKLEGRDTGSVGHEIAARFVAAEFAKAGLQPAGSDGWFTPVRLVRAMLEPGSASVTLTGKDGARSFAHGQDAMVAASFTAPATVVEAPLVFAGFGLDAPAQGHNDYAGIDARGKIVVVLSGIPKGPPDEVVAHLADTKADMARARGAVGMVSIQTLDARKRRPWARLTENPARPAYTWTRPDGTPNIEGGIAVASLSQAAAEALFAGARTPLDTVLAAADRDRGRPKGFALPGRLRIAARSTQTVITSPNVVGVLPGTDPALKAEHVLLMGHLDHIGVSPGKPDTINNGALDNAAGVATLLEVARAFQAAGAPRRSVLFAASTAEERGLLGAETMAEAPPVPAASIVAAVDLDMPLLLYPFTDVIAFGADHTTMGATIRAATAAMGITASPDPMPEETIFVRSDHYAFVKRGVPAVMLATGFANGGEKAWGDFLSTNYHQPSDDMRQPIDWQAGARFAEVNYRITRSLADAPDRPRWYANDFFGATFAPAAPKAERRQETRR